MTPAAVGVNGVRPAHLAARAGGGERSGLPGAAYVVFVIARKELRDALRNRWFLIYAACFAALSATLAYVALAGTGQYGVAGFGRTAASLVNLVLLIVPLMALTVGAGAISGERERGTLEALLAQPLRRLEVLLGKYLGSAFALMAALACGFGLTALLLLSNSAAGRFGNFAAIFAASVLLAWAMLSVGYLIGVFARRSSLALGVALFVWLALAFLGDLGLMGGALVLRLTTSELLALALLNPLQVFKLEAVSSIHRSIDLLGPAGLYAAQTYGTALPWLLVGILSAWILVPLALAALVFAYRGLR